jgi:hypothetical protein
LDGRHGYCGTSITVISSMPPVFRKTPPIDIILQILSAFGLKSLNDISWFSKSHIRLQLLEEILLELEPYYMPCKAKEYLYNTLTPLRAVTILRQVLKTQDIHLVSNERGRGNVKTIWYSIEPQTIDIQPGQVEFN